MTQGHLHVCAYVQVIAVACDGIYTSVAVSRTFNIWPIEVEISVSLSGSLTQSKIAVSPDLQRKLISGLANALGVLPDVVQLVPFPRSRRLQWIVLTFRVSASSATQAELLYLQASSSAEFVHKLTSQWQALGLDVNVEECTASTWSKVPEMSTPTPIISTASLGKSNDHNAGAIIGVVIGAVLGTVGMCMVIYIRRKKKSIFPMGDKPLPHDQTVFPSDNNALSQQPRKIMYQSHVAQGSKSNLPLYRD